MNFAYEYIRINNLMIPERIHWNKGLDYVAGLDEAGRGPLAGPVVAAAVIFPKTVFIPFVNDSKQLSGEIREFLYDIIQQESLAFGIGLANVDEIDRINIYHASYLAMERAVNKLRIHPEHLLVDGKSYLSDAIPFTALVDGDCRSFTIAAASILAKVTRDRLMHEYHIKFPQYGFDRHKGYSTRAHLDAIEKFGFCSIHRKSFHPKRFFESNQLSFEYEDKQKQS